MKLSKILLGAVAGAAVLGLMSCGPIAGAGNRFTIDQTNSESTTLRWYKDTATKHAGGLVKVTFKDGCDNVKANDSSKTYGTGMLGTMFGFEDSENLEKAHDFYLLSISDKGNYYLSKYWNIVDDALTEANFGVAKANVVTGSDASSLATKIAAGTPCELSMVVLASDTKVDMNTDSTANETYIYLYERAVVDGSYEVAILNLTDDEADSFKVSEYTEKEYNKDTATYDAGTSISSLGSKVLFSKNIPTTVTGLKPLTKESDVTQKKLAVYANVYGGNTLKGEWYYCNMYKEAEVIE